MKNKNRPKSQRAVKRQDNQAFCLGDACLIVGTDGCVELSLDGCSNSDSCLSFDGCFGFDGCSAFSGIMAMPFLLVFRLSVILGLMLYGDWDYKHHCAKASHYRK